MRWASLAAGLALIVVAFAAATLVADTREGLIAEVVTLFGGLAGVSLLLYGMLAGARRTSPQLAPAPAPRQPAVAIRPLRDLVIGAGGVLVALILLGGLAVSGGWLWAMLGCALLLPMIAGSAYLCVRFARAPARDWKLELRKTGRS